MSNWKAGDRAMCVDDRPSMVTRIRWLKSGTIYLVERLDEDGDLLLCGDPTRGYRFDDGWMESRFQKLIPACDRKAINAEHSE